MGSATRMKYWVGQELDWEAPTTVVTLCVELPFWMMVPDCIQEVEVNGHLFTVEIKEGYVEQYAGTVTDSRSTCIYFGPPKTDQTIRETNVIDLLLKKLGKKHSAQIMNRKCKTVLRIRADCNKDVLTARKQGGARRRAAALFLIDFCMAHVEVINQLVQHYRLSTYDYFAYEVSPWDVPVWFIESKMTSGRLVLLDYVKWVEKPIITSGASHERYKLIDETQLRSAMTVQRSAGEFELLDALNFMERGDYSGAIRRITTAIEAQTESVLRQELLRIHPAADVEAKLEASMNDFPGRLRQYEKLTNRKLPAGLRKELDTTRDLRHKIVHRALRIMFNQRGQAQRAVDTGRWIFNWLENQPARSRIREQWIAKRSLGRNFSYFNAEITAGGVIVQKPSL